MWAVYIGNLTASLAEQRVHWPFNDLDGLSNSAEYKFIIDEGSFRMDLFKVRLISYAIN